MKTLLSLLVLALLSPILNAQDGQLKFYYGPADVKAMASEVNYIWFGTNTGLFRYSAESGDLKVFQTANSDILANQITSIAIDRKGVKWIGLQNGISVFDGTSWKNYKISDFIPYVSDYILSITFDKDNTAWIGTYSGLVRFDGNNWTVFKPAVENNYFYVNSVQIDYSGIKWIASSRGLEKFDGSTWTLIDSTKGGMNTGGIDFLAIDGKGNKWFSRPDKILYKYDGIKITSYKIPPTDSPTFFINITSISVDNNDLVWIGTDRLLSFDGNSWTSYNQKDYKLPGSHINCTILDYSGTLWAGTDKNAAKFNGSSFTTFDLSNSKLPGNNIREIVSDNNGDIWVINDGYLSVYKNGFWHNFDNSNSGLPPSYISSVTFDRMNNAWIGTGNGLVKYDGDRTWTVYNSNNSGLVENEVEALAFDSKGVLWIATYEGLAKFDGHNWKFYNKFNSGFSGQTQSIAVDHEDVKWIGLGTGLLKFDDYSWKKFENVGWINFIYIDKNDTKWFTTGGIAKYDNMNWKSFYSDHIVNSIIPISQDSLIFASTHGLGQFDFSTEKETSHPINSKLISSSLTALCLDKNNNLWVGSDGGGIAVYNQNGVTSDVSGGLLQQNFPNPFNSYTTIFYNVPSAGTTVLKVYDVLGREVTTLVDEFKTPGTYAVNFYAGSRAGGVYVYSVTSGGKKESKKLVLLK